MSLRGIVRYRRTIAALSLCVTAAACSGAAETEGPALRASADSLTMAAANDAGAGAVTRPAPGSLDDGAATPLGATLDHSGHAATDGPSMMANPPAGSHAGHAAGTAQLPATPDHGDHPAAAAQVPATPDHEGHPAAAAVPAAAGHAGHPAPAAGAAAAAGHAGHAVAAQVPSAPGHAGHLPAGAPAPATPGHGGHPVAAAPPHAASDSLAVITDPGMTGLLALVAGLVQDSIVLRRIEQDPVLREAWRDAGVRQLFDRAQ